jgi:hypothetical protein
MVTMSIESPADLSAFGKARATIEGAPLTRISNQHRYFTIPKCKRPTLTNRILG